VSNSLKKLPKPKKKRQKAKQEQPKTSLRAIVGWVAGILGLITGVVTLLPRVTAVVSDPVDPDNPFSASVTITNTGYVPLTSVKPWYGLKKTTFGNPAMPTVFQNDGSKVYPKLDNAKWHPADLGLDDKFTFGLNDIWGKPSALLSADMAIVIEYQIPIIHWRREKTFPFTAERQTNGHFYWYAKAP
jgi:hypothetical protein